MKADIRKLVVTVEETRIEAGRAVDPPTRKAVAAAVIANPFAGRFVEDLTGLTEIGEALGALLGKACVEALGVAPEAVESYGKSAMVGEDGDIEHAAAILHPRLGAPLRAAVGGGAALVPSSKKRGGPGQALDIPLGHKDAAYIRSHFDGAEIAIHDAPRAAEIVVAVALTDSGRPAPRVGGLTRADAEGRDGLR